MFSFSKKSITRLEGVHPSLISVANLALSYGFTDMTVVKDGGMRTSEEQRRLVEKQVSKTMNSKHLIQNDGYGHAMDIAPYPLDWNDIDGFIRVAQCIRLAANESKVKIVWGSVWDKPLNELSSDLKSEIENYVLRRKRIGRSAFLDYPHFQYEGSL